MSTGLVLGKFRPLYPLGVVLVLAAISQPPRRAPASLLFGRRGPFSLCPHPRPLPWGAYVDLCVSSIRCWKDRFRVSPLASWGRPVPFLATTDQAPPPISAGAPALPGGGVLGLACPGASPAPSEVDPLSSPCRQSGSLASSPSHEAVPSSDRPLRPYLWRTSRPGIIAPVNPFSSQSCPLALSSHQERLSPTEPVTRASA